MKKLRFTFLIAALLLVFTATFVTMAHAAAPPAINWYVMAGGGSHVESGDGVFALDSTIGQPTVGTSGDLCSGFWCGFSEWLAELHIYLPFITGG